MRKTALDEALARAPENSFRDPLIIGDKLGCINCLSYETRHAIQRSTHLPMASHGALRRARLSLAIVV
jgi:hypothetical protein